MTTGNDLVNLLLSQQGAAYIFGAENDATDPNSPKRRGTDCSEFGEWACDRLGVKPEFPDGTWNQVSAIRRAGLIIPAAQALRTVGAAVFSFSSDPFLGKRPAQAHVAFTLGDGERTIEARGKAYGTGIFGGASKRTWTHAGLIPGIDYAPANQPAPPPTTGSHAPGFPGRILLVVKGNLMRGADVTSVQKRLQARGWKITVDGVYGPGTEKVVIAFQREKRLAVDGKVGPSTWQALWTAPVT